MRTTDTLECPVSDCSKTGALSQIIHHVTEAADERHSWPALGYENSYQFRSRHETAEDLDADSGQSTDSDDETGRSDPENGTATLPSDPPSLESIPGIGETRATALREAGYEYAQIVAAASTEDLSAADGISERTAKCVRTAAREACGYPETVISEVAESLGQSRTAVADAYGPLAARNVLPAEAKETLKLRFGDDEGSIMDLDGYSTVYLHFLREAGFERLEDVADATVAELATAKYVGEARAETIRDRTRRKLSTTTSTPEPDGETVQPDTERATPARESAPIETVIPENGSKVPPKMAELDQWLLWKQTDDGRKVPRAPWKTGDALQYVSAMDPENWTSFQTALEWHQKLPQNLELAFALTRDDEFVFLDFDDVAIDGYPTDAVEELIETAGTYGAISTSGTGIHLFGTGSLSEGIKSITGQLTEDGDQSIEVYDKNRFIAITGDHLESTPTMVNPVDELLADLEAEFATVSANTPDRVVNEPTRSKDELQDIETTGDIQDIFDAISQTQPSDISMRSTQTNTHGDGTYSYDPSWVHSESGTRLGVLDDCWIYRKGMIRLDALQLVALEEGIITDERDYPEGEVFWDAVNALRERGAHVPRYEPDSDATIPEGPDSETNIDEREIATRLNYGQEVRTHIHPYDRDYQERLALRLAPMVAEAAEALQLSGAVANRSAAIYAAGHAAGLVRGAAHEATVAAAIRIASIEAGTPRPLETISEELETPTTTIRTKFQKLMQQTAITDAIDTADLIPDPVDYVPYIARKLDLQDDTPVTSKVRELLASAETHGGTSPMSEVGAAFYVVLMQDPEYDHTQQTVADSVGVSAVTIRNNYQKFADAL